VSREVTPRRIAAGNQASARPLVRKGNIRVPPAALCAIAMSRSPVNYACTQRLRYAGGTIGVGLRL